MSAHTSELRAPCFSWVWAMGITTLGKGVHKVWGGDTPGVTQEEGYTKCVGEGTPAVTPGRGVHKVWVSLGVPGET